MEQKRRPAVIGNLGVLYFVHFGSIDMAPLLAGLAIAAGVFILLDR